MVLNSHENVTCDYDDVVARFGIDMRSELELRNLYSPLADMLRDTSTDVWTRCEYEVLGSESNNLKVICASILTSEHAIKPTMNKLRLNSTTPGNPEVAEMLGLTKEKEKGEKREASFGEGDHAKNGKVDNPVTKAERKAFVLARVCEKFRRCEHQDFAVIQWLILSSATPAWKMQVYDSMYHEGTIPYCGVVLTRNTIGSMVVTSAMRYRTVTTVQEQELRARLFKAFMDGKFCALVIDEMHCLGEDCSSWLSGYQLYKQADSEAHQKYLTSVSAFMQLKHNQDASRE